MEGRGGSILEFLMRLWERGPARTEHQREQGRPQQRQSAGRIGVFQSALVLTSNDVTAPVHNVLHSPIAADLLRDPRRQSRLSSVAGNEIARPGLFFPAAFVGSAALDADQMGSVRIMGRIRLDANQACGPLVYEAIGGLRLGKRGVVLSNFC